MMKWTGWMGLALAGLLSPGAWGQDEAPGVGSGPVPAAAESAESGRVPQRSELWMAVESQSRQRAAEDAAEPWQLSGEQREQLRTQIRRGTAAEADAAGRAAPVQSREP